MKYKIINLTSLLLCLTLLISGCAKATDEKKSEDQILNLQASLTTQEALVTQLKSENESLKLEVDQLKQVQLSPETPFIQVLTVIQLLADLDMNALSPYIHPTKGVRFSPYGYVDTANHLVFTQEQLSTLMADTEDYTWGSYDGSGEPIIKTFSEYYAEFVYDEDFINPHLIGNNVVVGTGNSLINITEVYPEGIFVEFHFTGFDPQYEGIDWVSLRLVFEELDGAWYLVGVIHDQWTI